VSPAIRPARASDAGAIARLCGELGYPATAVDIEVRRGAIEQSAEHVLLVAEVDADVVGWLHAGVSHAIEHERCVEIRGLVVDERARGQSIGAALVTAAERWTRMLGIAQVRVRSRDTRERAHRFYEREGYTAVKTSKVFEKHLEAE
jgi:GNAT superfamily N-acetyltransferase